VSSFSNKSYSRNFLTHSKVILHDIFYDTSVKFLGIYPLLYTTGMCDVYNIYLYGKCFLSMMYNDIICMSAQSMLLFVSSDSSSHTYATSQSSSLCIERHTSCRNSVLCVCLFSEHTRHCRCFPLEGQCCECFTSSQPSWDAVGLGLPLEMPLAVTSPLASG